MKTYKEILMNMAAVYCNCNKPDDEPKYKPDGIDHLGCTKHGWICKKCGKYIQIG